MEQLTHDPRPGALVERLTRATNDHDLEALLNCFHVDFRNETPAHPARSFRGRAQVERNWAHIFTVVPDLTTEVRWIADQHTAWSEWEMRGTRRDGSAFAMRGVVIFGVQNGQATWARFYLEPVEMGGGDVNATIRRTVDLVGDPGEAPGEQAPARGES